MTTLDVRGEMCPYPAMKARDALASLRDDTLVVITDHAPALTTVPWEGAKAGFDPEIQTTGAGEWRITLRRAGGTFDARAAMAKIAQQVQAVEAQ